MLRFDISDVIANVNDNFFSCIILSLNFDMLVTLASICVQFEPAYGLHLRRAPSGVSAIIKKTKTESYYDV